MSILSIILGILGLSFLVFIHELGHYIMARRAKMKVEVFSIGFGKPIFSWTRSGVKWQVCFIPCGGYVKIAGMHAEKGKEPSDIKDGFFAKKPIDRIKVAFAGPFVNIVFAFVIFSFLYFLGGREQPFHSYTKKIGWVDENSQLYQKGIRPGDEIKVYDDRAYTGIRDVLVSGAMAQGPVHIQGNKIDYLTGAKEPFDFTLDMYETPFGNLDHFHTIGVRSPAKFMIYSEHASKLSQTPISDALKLAGLKTNDRLTWVNGEMIFSPEQLERILNESSAYLTIERDGKIQHTRVPKAELYDLHVSNEFANELKDWKFEASLGQPYTKLQYIPYQIDNHQKVTKRISYFDKEQEKLAYRSSLRPRDTFVLQKGDKIIAVDGTPIHSPYALLEQLQKKQALVMVQRNQSVKLNQAHDRADSQFQSKQAILDAQKVIDSIGTSHLIESQNDIALLKPVPLIQVKTINIPNVQNQLKKMEQEILSTTDLSLKEKKAKALAAYKNSYVLQIPLNDKSVMYNPSPIFLFKECISDFTRTLSGLFGGTLSPKHLSGPLGIMHVVQQSWSVGICEALFWMGMISLNLALLNLLPMPVFDGGHILFSLIETVTKKPIKAKTMERLIMPFVVLVIGFFLYVTFYDVVKIFNFWK